MLEHKHAVLYRLKDVGVSDLRRAGCLVYGFREPKRIASLALEEVLKGEPLQGDQGPYLELCSTTPTWEVSSMPDTKHGSNLQHSPL